MLTAAFQHPTAGFDSTTNIELATGNLIWGHATLYDMVETSIFQAANTLSISQAYDCSTTYGAT